MTTSTQSHTSIPLNKLIAWDGNVRKTNPDHGLDELKASIFAHGLLQSLVVRKTSRGKFSVIAGRRRYLALSSLAGSGVIETDTPVPCHIVAGTADATEISLTENIVRAPMHPADQFEAFQTLIDAGASPSDVAARFGLSEIAVRQRLKLARVSPNILRTYRAGAITLQQVQAFAISDDHEAQERVYSELPDWNNDADAIRDALTEDEIPLSDRRARYVTLQAYEDAGGSIRRDLFAEDDNGVFVLDVELLDRLAMEKLVTEAETIKAEGWNWVDAYVQFDRSQINFRTRHPERLPLSEAAAAEQKRLSDEYNELFDSQDDHDDEVTEQLEALEARVEALSDTPRIYTPEIIAIAGAIVTIDHDGELHVLRGLVRPEDEPEGARCQRAGAKERPEFPSSLVQDLTEARSAAIGACLADSPDIALAATVYALVGSTFDRFHNDPCVGIKSAVSYYRGNSKGADALERIQAEWEERLPGNHTDRWEWCLQQDRDTLLSLLAYCAGRTVNAVQKKEDRDNCPRLTDADRLAAALGLSMAEWFTPSAENYFQRVGKPQIVADIAEATKRPAKLTWDKLKKSELAALAARETAGTGWLPKPIRA
jgi:ParB family chromosome partitioning protein